MRHKKSILLLGLSLLSILMIAAGLFRVVQVYRHYRESMLTYESRHLHSIASSSARGLGWMLDGFEGQALELTARREFLRAEETYLADGDAESMRLLMARPDVMRPFTRAYAAVYDPAGEFLASSDAQFPLPNGTDSAMGDVVIRTDSDGSAWFVFSASSSAGFRYEVAERVRTVFSYQGETARVGQNGILFLLDREGRFVCYAGGGTIEICTPAALYAGYPDLSPTVFDDLSEWYDAAPEAYYVCRLPWQGAGSHGGEETLVVPYPVPGAGDSLLLGTAVSFRELDVFLSDMLHEVTGVILMEIGGVLVLLIIAAWILIVNRRNSLELAAVRERADLMEEINRQQQSLAHTERLQQLGVMTSGIVHEFNNLLTPIMSQSMLLVEQLADQEDSPSFEYALDIYEASENAREMTRRMSAMGKRDGDIGFRTLELRELLGKTLNLAAMARSPHIAQVLTLPDEPLYIEGNEQLLTQAMLNLCINACQAMGDEGTLTVAAESEERSGRVYAAIRFSDTGPGIAEEKIGSLYDPFFTTKGEQGTGLGLAICQKIIETHKGTIQAANRPEGGAVFTVRIPACEPPDIDVTQGDVV